jgi:hypothetical protein
MNKLILIDYETIWLNRSQIFNLLSRDVKTIGKHIANVFKENELEKNSTVANFTTTVKDGQVYDAYVFITDLIKSAKKSIVLIDNYCDESVLTMLSKREKTYLQQFIQKTSQNN